MRKLLVWSVLLFFVYGFKLPQSFNWDSDWSRDLYDIARLVRGDFQLVGPTLAGGLYAGPYYYWIIAPFLALSGFKENFILLGHAWLFALGTSVGIVYFDRKLGWLSSIVFTCLLGLNPFWISVARHPWNGITYLPLLLVAYILFYFKKGWSWLDLLLYGFLWGVLLNFHPSLVVVLVPLGLWFVVRISPRRQLGMFVIGLIIAFIPLILFEIKNDLPITKGLLIYHRFANFSQASNPSVITAKDNGVENAWFMLNEINVQTFNTGWFLLIASVILVRKKGLGNESSLKVFVVLVGAITLEIIIVKGVFGPHYLYPISLLLIFISVVLISKSNSRIIKFFFLGVYSIMILINLSKFNPTDSTESGLMANKAVTTVIEKGFINKNDKFAVMGVKSLPMYVPYGHEYRYFFLKHSLNPEKITDYFSADKLIVFSEVGEVTKEDIRSWETDQFGANYLKSPIIIKSGSVLIQIYSK